MTYTDFSANRPLFGPSGHSESFTAEGHTATTEMPEWIKARGLDLFEYSFGRGVNISSKTATEIGNSTGISDRTARKHIALLRTRGIIRRHGSNKTGYWELTEDI